MEHAKLDLQIYQTADTINYSPIQTLHKMLQHLVVTGHGLISEAIMQACKDIECTIGHARTCLPLICHLIERLHPEQMTVS